MRRVVAEVDRRADVTNVSRVEESLSTVLARPRFNFLIVAAFASIALLLSAFGTYAILSAFVRQQMRELGIRSALGAAPGQIFRSVITRGLGLATMGLVAGIVITLGLSRLLTSLLYEVSSLDPLTLSASVVGMLAVAILACWRPAKAASNIDPLRVLRMD
jgi:putative ABC transport system permease protein